MASTRRRWTAAGRCHDDSERRPPKGPVANNCNFLNLADSFDFRRILPRLGARGCSKIGFAHHRLTRHEKDDIVGHQTWHFVDFARLVAAIQVETSSRISCSSVCVDMLKG